VVSAEVLYWVDGSRATLEALAPQVRAIGEPIVRLVQKALIRLDFRSLSGRRRTHVVRKSSPDFKTRCVPSADTRKRKGPGANSEAFDVSRVSGN